MNCPSHLFFIWLQNTFPCSYKGFLQSLSICYLMLEPISCVETKTISEVKISKQFDHITTSKKCKKEKYTNGNMTLPNLVTKFLLKYNCQWLSSKLVEFTVYPLTVQPLYSTIENQFHVLIVIVWSKISWHLFQKTRYLTRENF